MSIALISGSPSASSRSARLLNEARLRLESAGEKVEWIAIRDLPPGPLLLAQEDGHINSAVTAVLNARAVVVASPIYKVAYSGLLKAFLDLLPEKALEDKVVLPISSAGSPHHSMALDFTIRPVLAALGAREVISPVCALDVHIQPLPNGLLRVDPQISQRLDESVALLLKRLWALEPISKDMSCNSLRVAQASALTAPA